jgi:hypothetical protein
VGAVRPLAAPTPIRVRTDDIGRPRQVSGAGRFRQVLSVREIWRIDDEWWRRPISRLYYEVVLETGRLVTLFHDLEEGRWYAA